MDYSDRRDKRDRNAVPGDPVPDDAIFHREHYAWGSHATYQLPDGTLWMLCHDFDDNWHETRVYWVKGYREILRWVTQNWVPLTDHDILEKERLTYELRRLDAAPV